MDLAAYLLAATYSTGDVMLFAILVIVVTLLVLALLGRLGH